MQKSVKNSYHIHVDATALDAELLVQMHELGLEDTNFSGHPDGYQHFEPNVHMTLKLENKLSFRTAWEQIVAVTQENKTFVGYLEGEFLSDVIQLPEEPAHSAMPCAPFKITRRCLRGAPHENFRAAELHFTFDKDRSDQRLIACLLEAGLYGAYLPKVGYTGLVLTAQGNAKEVSELFDRLHAFLVATGGVVCGVLKKEAAISHKLFGVDHTTMPEVIDTIEWRNE